MRDAFYQGLFLVAIKFLFLLVIANNIIGWTYKDKRAEEFYYTVEYGEKKKLRRPEIEKYLRSQERFYNKIKKAVLMLIVVYFIYKCCSCIKCGWWNIQISLSFLIMSCMQRWEQIDPEGFKQRMEGEVAVEVVEDKGFLGKLRVLFDFAEMKIIVLIKTNERIIIYACKDDRFIQATNKCPECGTVSRSLKESGSEYVEYKDLSLFEMKVSLRVRKDRFRCNKCEGKSFTVEFSILSEHSRITKRLQFHIRRLLGKFDRESLAVILGVDVYYIRQEEESVIEESQKTVWYEEEEIVQSDQLLHLGIDEHSVRKGHRYVTILYDKVNKRLLDMIEGRSAQEVREKLFKGIPESVKARIASLTMDRCKGYLSAASSSFCGKILIIIDKFHIIRDAGSALQKVRKRWKDEESKKIEKEYKEQIKGLRPEEAKKIKKRENPFSSVRNILLVNPIKLEIKAEDSDKEKKSKMESQKKLKEALSLSPELEQAYRLFNEFRNILDDKKIDKQGAKERLSSWYEQIEKSQIKEFIRLKKSFEEWEPYILNYFALSERLTNANLEGINNKCKKVQRQMYGIGGFQTYKFRCKVEVNGIESIIGKKPAMGNKSGSKVVASNFGNCAHVQEPALEPGAGCYLIAKTS